MKEQEKRHEVVVTIKAWYSFRWHIGRRIWVFNHDSVLASSDR